MLPLSSQLEEEEAKTDQIKQSGVLVNIQPPEQAQIFAQEEPEKTIEFADSIQTPLSYQLESEVLFSIQQPEQAQTFAQKDLPITDELKLKFKNHLSPKILINTDVTDMPRTVEIVDE